METLQLAGIALWLVQGSKVLAKTHQGKEQQEKHLFSSSLPGVGEASCL